EFGAICAQLLSDLDNGDLLAILAQALKLHLAALEGEQGVVAALAHVDAGMDMGAPLANQDVAGQDELAVAPLHAQALGLGITAVAGGADALLVGEKLQTDVQHGIHTSKLVCKSCRAEVNPPPARSGFRDTPRAGWQSEPSGRPEGSGTPTRSPRSARRVCADGWTRPFPGSSPRPPGAARR